MMALTQILQEEEPQIKVLLPTMVDGIQITIIIRIKALLQATTIKDGVHDVFLFNLLIALENCHYF